MAKQVNATASELETKATIFLKLTFSACGTLYGRRLGQWPGLQLQVWLPLC